MRQYKHWKEDEIKLLKKLYKTHTDRELHEIINHSIDCISQKRLDLGLIKGNKAWTLEDEHFIRDNYNEMSDKEIGDKIKRSKGSVQVKRCSMGLYRKTGNIYQTGQVRNRILENQRKAKAMGVF